MIPLTAKQVRSTHSALKSVQCVLERHAALLHRLYYKSKAQHRSAKWFQSIDGVRKCFRRLLSDLERSDEVFLTSSSRHINAIEVDASLPNRAGHAERRARNNRKFAAASSSSESSKSASRVTRYPALVTSTCVAVTDTWCSFWESRGEGAVMLPKFDRPPTSSASEDRVRTTISHLFCLAIALEELICRTEVSFGLLMAQLRTPPAPTFAALVATLCTLMAAINHATQTILWGSVNESFRTTDEQSDMTDMPTTTIPVRPEDAISIHYMHFCRSLNAYDASKVGIIDGRSRKLKHEWIRYSNLIQRASGRSDEGHSWLPHVLQRKHDENQGQPMSRTQTDLERMREISVAGTMIGSSATDEDIGEAI